MISCRAPTILHAITKDQRSISCKRDSLLALVFPVIVDEDDVEGVEVAWDIPAFFSVNNFLTFWLEGTERETYPRNVHIRFISKSPPQPATMKTPNGGTIQLSSVSKVWMKVGKGDELKIVMRIRQIKPIKPILLPCVRGVA